MGTSFVPNSLYTRYFPQNRSFEEVCFNATVLKTEMHTYTYLSNIDTWLNIYAMPIDYEDGNICYCAYTATPSRSAYPVLNSINSAQTSNDVLKTCVKLHGADNMKDAMEGVISEIRRICSAECCTVLLMNDIARRMENIPIEQPELPNIEDMHIIGEAWERSPAEMEQPELLVMRDENGGRHTYRYQCHRTSIPDERVFIVEDVTSEEQEKQEIFEESKNKALNRIISGIAHEIKNPLTTIRTYASLAKDQGDDPEFLESFQEYVPREVDRISRMIETLMNYSRPPRGQIERFSMASVVDDCLGIAYISAKKKIRIETDLDRELYVYTSKEPIRQALVNLLMNSVESVETKLAAGVDPADLFVRVRVFRRESFVVTEVYDTGTGMTEEQVQQCTDPFFTTKTTGTGMGLAMSKMYIRETGGSLEVESALGEFTIMRMVFKEDIANVKA